MKLFLLKRLYGLAAMVEGFVYFFTSKHAGVALKVAKLTAKERGRRRMEDPYSL